VFVVVSISLPEDGIVNNNKELKGEKESEKTRFQMSSLRMCYTRKPQLNYYKAIGDDVGRVV
jgi:hypothetical protein